MSWATPHVERLKAGEIVSFRPKGRSMEPLVMSGQKVTLTPVGRATSLVVGDVVLCCVTGRYFLHLIKAISRRNDGHERYQIGNNKGGVNGWITRNSVYGRLHVIHDCHLFGNSGNQKVSG